MSGRTDLQEIGDGVFAYLQQGGWGFSNAGLICSHQGAMLVDTLYDLASTRRMLESMRSVLGAQALDAVVNTHANGDHCWGNGAVGRARIVSSRAAAEEMRELSPRLMHTLVQASRAITRLGPLAKAPLRLLGSVGLAQASALADAAQFVLDAFGPFEFGGLTLRMPDQTFEDRLVLDVGDKQVGLLEVGPAHTRGDVVVHVPEDRVVYTGDILFIGSHPIAWEGPVNNWIAACDRILALNAQVIVPGHGPLTDAHGVREVRDYWVRLQADAREAQRAGLSPEAAAHELRARYPGNESERLVVNLTTLYRELRGDTKAVDPLLLLGAMGRLAHRAAAAG